MLLQSAGPPLQYESTHRWAIKTLNKLKMSITQNLQAECAAKPDHPSQHYPSQDVSLFSYQKNTIFSCIVYCRIYIFVHINLVR